MFQFLEKNDNFYKLEKSFKKYDFCPEELNGEVNSLMYIFHLLYFMLSTKLQEMFIVIQ